MSYLPKKKDFRSAKSIPKKCQAAGLLLLEQKDGCVFALEQTGDIQRAYQSALPRRAGYWSRARWLHVPDHLERAGLLLALTLLWEPKRRDSLVDEALEWLERLAWIDG